MSSGSAALTDIEISGTSVSPGIAFGRAYHFAQIDLKTLEKQRIPIDNMESELARLDSALEKSVDQLRSLQAGGPSASRDIFDIFQVQIQILSDASFLSNIKLGISESKVNLEYVIANHIRDLEKKFNSLQTEVFRSKLLDVQDVYHRLLRNILDIEHVRVTPLRNMPQGVIIIAERLLPSDVALLDLTKIGGIVIENGSTVSHVSIIAKSLGVPAIINLPGVLTLVRPDSPLIIDGHLGMVIVRPSAETEARYQKKLSLAAPRFRTAKTRKCITKDGIAVRLEANAGSLAEVREALQSGAEGIGLLRTELFYLSVSRLPSIEEETAYYRSVFSVCKDRPVTVRLLDIGADKTLPYLGLPRDENPFLGVRGVRFLLENPTLLDNHLSAILRAIRSGGNARILVPFVSLPEEIVQIGEALERAGKREGVERSKYALGMMVEVPAAAVSLGSFLDKVDFFSIGTNDLVQYAFAASRENSKLERYRTGSFSVLLGLIKIVVDANGNCGRDIVVCGEVASDPALAPCLIGLGIRTLSMQTSALSGVCKEIEKHSHGELVTMAQKLLEARHVPRACSSLS